MQRAGGKEMDMLRMTTKDLKAELKTAGDRVEELGQHLHDTEQRVEQEKEKAKVASEAAAAAEAKYGGEAKELKTEVTYF